ncbi:MAG TPA: carboxypeptidase-like regulatory domain-containing protein [Vicinamibacterales bacterium]|nr:carboxypeptidase-like regulatory domain-containing protein [Vicinamibacterales bacterium]
MTLRHVRAFGALVFAVAAAMAAVASSGAATQIPTASVAVDRDDIGGVVTGNNGPEAGVWVIAETTDLPTKFAKIVVTDDRGRYLVPDLPNARYSVWVRGYGLVDSSKTQAAPGTTLDLRATAAPTAAAAAQYYPPIYWFSMMHVPTAREFPLPKIKSQGEWLNIIKTGACQSCHALGTPGTRAISKELGTFANSAEAWQRRLRSGQASALMARDITRLDTQVALRLFGDWTDRIAAGELPFAKPERPRGIERNVVITQWDWGRPTAYLHDAISTDPRNPRVNANGKIYGSPEDSSDFVPILDPKTNVASEVLHPVRDPNTPSTKTNPMAPSAFWGPDPIWDGKTLNHNPMMDEKGRVWFTPRVRPDANPDFCKQGSDHPSARAFPLQNSGRHLSMFDPATGAFTLISTCFPTHHLNFAHDASQTLWTSAGIGGPGVIGWLNRKMFEDTHDEVRSQGWTPFVVDTNGNGKRDAYVEPGEPSNPAKDTRVLVNTYAVAVSPADGSVWGTVVGYRGAIVRVVPGPDPTHTALTEIYEPPAPGFGPRGGDVDSNGVYWVSLASGHLASFDRRKCRSTAKPSATGEQCAEGWTFFQLPGPQLKDVTDAGSAEASYYTWIDRFDVVGLGRNVPIAMGNLNSSIFALVGGRFINITLPYPMGFFAKNVDARIDDPNAGWKGRALWSTYGTRAMFHLEGGTANQPKAVRIQLRPDPLAR